MDAFILLVLLIVVLVVLIFILIIIVVGIRHFFAKFLESFLKYVSDLIPRRGNAS
jgi:hypothetical protein